MFRRCCGSWQVSRTMSDETNDSGGPSRRGRAPWLELLALALYGLALVAFRPLDPFEWDEVLFQRALDRYDVAAHSPHPPGYPLFVAAAKAVRAVVGDPQVALQVVAISSALAAIALTWLLARRLGAPRGAATLAAAVLATVPGFAFNGNIGMSDVPGVAAAAGVALLFACALERPWLLVTAAGAAGALSGVRVAGLVIALPLAAAAARAVLRRRAWKPLALAPVAFGLGAAAVWAPAMLVTGPERFVGAVEQQAEYIQRAWVHMRLPGAPLRVIARAWGAHWLGTDAMAALLWLLVAAGAAAWWLGGRRRLAAVAVAGAGGFLLFCAFELEYDLAMRYALPAAPLLAILASGVALLPRRTVRGAAVTALGAWIVLTATWVAPAFALRRRPAPVWQALHYVRASFPAERTTVVSDAVMGPHVDYVLRRAGFTVTAVPWEELPAAIAAAAPDTLFVTPTAPAGAEVLADIDWRSPRLLRLARDRYGSCAVWRRTRRPVHAEAAGAIIPAEELWRIEGAGTVALPASAHPAVMSLEARSGTVEVTRPGMPTVTLAPREPRYALAFPGPAGAVRLAVAGGGRAELEPVSLFDVRAENPVAGVASLLVAPQAAQVDGSYASQWRTTLSLFNPSVHPVRVTVQLLASGQANPEPAVAEIEMAPREWLEVPDVLALPGLRGRARLGALVLGAVSSGARRALPSPLAAVTRTFDRRSSPPGGVPGESLPTVPLADGLCLGASGSFAGVTTGAARRANLGVAVLADAPVRLRVTVGGRAGALQEDATWDVPPFGHLQNRLPDGLDGASVTVTVADGPPSARAFAYLSQIDRASGAVLNTLPAMSVACPPDAAPPLPGAARR